MDIELDTATPAVDPLLVAQPLVASWYRCFEHRTMQLRRVLYIAIEHDQELLRGIQAVVGEFPHHRQLNRWLLQNEDQPFFNLDGKSLRFVHSEDGWQLRPADNLMSGAS